MYYTCLLRLGLVLRDILIKTFMLQLVASMKDLWLQSEQMMKRFVINNNNNNKLIVGGAKDGDRKSFSFFYIQNEFW